MSAVVDYLKNPISSGVWNARIHLHFGPSRDYLMQWWEKFQTDVESKKKTDSLENRLMRRRMPDVQKVVDAFLQETNGETFFASIEHVMLEFATSHDATDETKRLFARQRELPSKEGERVIRWVRAFRIPQIFEPRVIKEVDDVLAIEREPFKLYDWLFSVTSLSQRGLEAFKNRIRSIPKLSENAEMLKEKEQHSARYVYRPYTLAAELWLGDKQSILVPRDLKSFLRGAIRYYDDKEWRTSIVLSAIAVESVLADLFEENKKKPAPNRALGELLEYVKEAVNFPDEILKAIELTNRARIAAVHRSQSAVSDLDAMNALFGSLNVTLWYAHL